jgi:hypothetical protein
VRPKFAKRGVDQYAGGFGGESQSLEFRKEDVAHLKTSMRGTRDSEANLADIDAVVIDAEVAPGALGGQPMPESTGEVRAHLFGVHLSVVEVPDHVRVREETGVVVEVLLVDLAKNEPRRHDRR